jgi:hypothetical protein
VPGAIAYSWLAAHYRFTGFVSGLTFLAAELVILVLAGEGDIFSGGLLDLLYLVGAVLFFCLGMFLGMSEDSRSKDGF